VHIVNEVKAKAGSSKCAMDEGWGGEAPSVCAGKKIIIIEIGRW